MSLCHNCGTALSDNSPFCTVCGVGVPGSSGAAVRAAPVASALQPGTAGALAYLAGFVTGILFLLIEPYKMDRFVRFHAFQSILFNIAWAGLWMAWIAVGLVIGVLTKGLFFFIQLPIDLLLMATGFGIWVYLMYSASKGKTFRLPVIGTLAAKQAGL